jgi:coenzyme PQQ synthesis protein D (PqqD)
MGEIAKGVTTARPAPDVVSRRVGDVAVLVRLTTNRIYELNETGARLWELASAGVARDEILRQLTREFDADSAVVANEVDDLLEMFRAEGLLC